MKVNNRSEQQFQHIRLIRKSKPYNADVHIEGVPLIESDCQDVENDRSSFEQICAKLNIFKQQTAKKVAELHCSTNKSIEQIVQSMKTKIHAKAMEIINGHEQRTRSNTEKDIKNMDSTVAGSVEQRSKQKKQKKKMGSFRSTPKEFTIDLREFTLGNNQKSSSNRPKRKQRTFEPQVSEFNFETKDQEPRGRKDRPSLRFASLNA